MTDDWFNEYVYEVVVDRKYVPAEVLATLELEPTVLPAWDPMGALACSSSSSGSGMSSTTEMKSQSTSPAKL